MSFYVTVPQNQQKATPCAASTSHVSSPPHFFPMRRDDAAVRLQPCTANLQGKSRACSNARPPKRRTNTPLRFDVLQRGRVAFQSACKMAAYPFLPMCFGGEAEAGGKETKCTQQFLVATATQVRWPCLRVCSAESETEGWGKRGALVSHYVVVDDVGCSSFQRLQIYPIPSVLKV